jgi:hypothetical protein
MAFYHIKSPEIVEALEKERKAINAQKRAIRKVLRHYGEEKYFSTAEEGLLAIKAKNPSSYSKAEWCCFNRDKYGKDIIRPKRTAGGKEQREVFNQVPKVSGQPVLDAMGWKITWSKDHTRVLVAPSYAKFKGEWLMVISDWAVTQYKAPDGVEEITYERFKEMGGKIKNEVENENKSVSEYRVRQKL